MSSTVGDDSDGGSTLSDLPDLSDADLEEALRKTIRDAFAAGLVNGMTVRSVRASAEEALGLAPGYYKYDDHWKTRSMNIIRAEVRSQEKLVEETSNQSPGDTMPQAAGRKRRKSYTESTSEASKRTKTETLPEGDSTEINHDEVKEESSPQTPKIKRRNTKSKSTSNSRSEISAETAKSQTPSKKPRKSRKTKSTKQELTPGEAKIKQLEGWLVKCGIRRRWGITLASCSTDAEKIKYLNGMLKDAGMTGRCSNGKARAIKAARELKADIEAIKEGNAHWGLKEEDEEVGRGKRRVASGLRDLAGLVDEDETD